MKLGSYALPNGDPKTSKIYKSRETTLRRKSSAASRCILVPSERYRRPKKCAQKIVILFPHIFYVKSKLSIVYEYLKTKTFSRDTNILPQMH